MKSKRLLILILLCCLLLSGCGGEESRDSVSLWYLESEPAAESLALLVKEYNDSLPAGLLPVSVRSFPDEEALAAGFDTVSPDILLCSHNKAQELSLGGLTRETGFDFQVPLPKYRSYIYDRIPQAGRDIFPLGGDIQLVAAGSGAIKLSEKDSFNLEFLLSAAKKYGEEQRLPFISADSFSALFYQSLLNEGKEFHARKDYDIKNDEYIKLYNLIADTAYSGGLISSEYSGAELLKAGYLPCIISSGSELSRLPSEDFEVFALEAAGQRLSRLSCFTVTARQGRSTDSAVYFLSWLFSGGRQERLCMESGLVPLTESFTYNTDSPLEHLLIKIGMSEKLHFPENNCDFLLNNMDFEASFRKALGLLA